LAESGLNCSLNTVIRRLCENDLRCCVARRVEFLTNFHKISRFTFAENNGFLLNEAVFCDESTFVTGSPHKQYIYREQGSAFEEMNIQVNNIR
jgi:Transposase